jgi:hypothetical protein
MQWEMTSTPPIFCPPKTCSSTAELQRIPMPGWIHHAPSRLTGSIEASAMTTFAQRGAVAGNNKVVDYMTASPVNTLNQIL